MVCGHHAHVEPFVCICDNKLIMRFSHAGGDLARNSGKAREKYASDRHPGGAMGVMAESDHAAAARSASAQRAFQAQGNNSATRCAGWSGSLARMSASQA